MHPDDHAALDGTARGYAIVSRTWKASVCRNCLGVGVDVEITGHEGSPDSYLFRWKFNIADTTKGQSG
jgi:hypothetical protein